jgi:hypothetical protein
MIEVYIKAELDLHKVRHDLSSSDEITDEIISYVKRGIYAFQLIYDDWKKTNNIILVKPLDWTKVVQNLDFSLTLWSYDGGEKFQFSSIETLKFNIQKIRDLKLEEIFNEANL